MKHFLAGAAPWKIQKSLHSRRGVRRVSSALKKKAKKKKER